MESSCYIGYDIYKQGYPDESQNYPTGYIYEIDEHPPKTKEHINEQNQYTVQRQDRHAEHPKRTHPKSTHPKSTYPRRTTFDIYKNAKSEYLRTTKRNDQYWESNIFRKKMPDAIKAYKQFLRQKKNLDDESRAIVYNNEYRGMFLF